MKFKVVVTPKKAVLDPQGSAVRDAMRHLGMPEVQNVRIGKYMEIEVGSKDVDLEKRLHALCRDLLSNPVIEDYELERDGTAENNKTMSRSRSKKR
jgi:phosphoribosylformylglycinamidine synthase PurS subunit